MVVPDLCRSSRGESKALVFFLAFPAFLYISFTFVFVRRPCFYHRICYGAIQIVLLLLLLFKASKVGFYPGNMQKRLARERSERLYPTHAQQTLQETCIGLRVHLHKRLARLAFFSCSLHVFLRRRDRSSIPHKSVRQLA